MIHYTDTGNGLPLLLIHAFASDGALWRPQITEFSTRYRVVAPDLRGFGASPPTDGSAVAIDDYADDVVELMGAIGIHHTVLCGISLGGYVALSIALRHPHRVRGLVLANTRAGADNPEWAEFREALVRDIERRGAAAVVENYGDKPFRDDCPNLIKEEVRQLIRRQTATGLASGTRGMASRPDRLGDLHRIAAPTMIISGGQDKYIGPEDGQLMHEAIAGSRLAELPRAGHLSNIDSADEFNDVLRVFLADLDREPQA